MGSGRLQGGPATGAPKLLATASYTSRLPLCAHAREARLAARTRRRLAYTCGCGYGPEHGHRLTPRPPSAPPPRTTM
eukprot:scaffold12537_cov96-Isochrysis_galbana.AAC.1